LKEDEEEGFVEMPSIFQSPLTPKGNQLQKMSSSILNSPSPVTSGAVQAPFTPLTSIIVSGRRLSKTGGKVTVCVFFSNYFFQLIHFLLVDCTSWNDGKLGIDITVGNVTRKC
jgi:hypothetical protein